jgi:hypothetical protein
VQNAHGQFGLVRVDQHRNLDLAGRDRLNVDAASASVANMVAATPAWLRMPTPTTLILATLSSAIMRL